MNEWIVPEGAYALVGRTESGAKVMLAIEGGPHPNGQQAFRTALRALNRAQAVDGSVRSREMTADDGGLASIQAGIRNHARFEAGEKPEIGDFAIDPEGGVRIWHGFWGEIFTLMPNK